jgi:hypothetical protein
MKWEQPPPSAFGSTPYFLCHTCASNSDVFKILKSRSKKLITLIFLQKVNWVVLWAWNYRIFTCMIDELINFRLFRQVSPNNHFYSELHLSHCVFWWCSMNKLKCQYKKKSCDWYMWFCFISFREDSTLGVNHMTLFPKSEP